MTIVLNPPYASTGQSDAVLEIFRRVSPKKIDSKFIVENNIATRPNASTVVNFVKWLGIIDAKNNVVEEIASKLRLMGKERDLFIIELIKKAYKEVLERVNLQQARREDLVNFFIHNYGFGIAPAKGAAVLLSHLCEKYGIPISDELKKKTHRNVGGTKKILRPKVKLNQKPKSKLPESPIEKGVIMLSIKGNGINKELIAKTAEELQKLYDVELKSLVTGAKHFFPNKPVEEELED